MKFEHKNNRVNSTNLRKMTLIEEYQHISNHLGLSGYLNGTGGNCSVKSNDEIIISASGEGIGGTPCLCRLESLADVKTEKEYFAKGKTLVIEPNGLRPSMEYGFHFLLPQKYVVHLHIPALNVILCSQESFQIIIDLFDNITTFYYQSYITPGFDLFRNFYNKTYIDQRKIYFLENHGLIVTSNNVTEIFDKLFLINSTITSWMNRPLYPDAAILPEKNIAENKEILRKMINLGLTPNFLSENQIQELKNLEYEKYRSGRVAGNDTER